MIAVYVGAEPRFSRRNSTLGHLQACPTCARRYQAFVGEMDDLRADAVTEADEIFTPARLEAQRQQILARLEHMAHPARVIPFPTHGAANLSIFTGTQVRRWIAAAAAAGLLMGLTLGRVADLLSPPRAAETRVITTPQPARPETVATPNTEAVNEEEILSRVEQAQGELQVPAELEALGGITPIRDVAMRLPPRR